MLTEPLFKLIKHPFRLYIIWIIFSIIFYFIAIPALSRGASGGEQLPFVYSSYLIITSIYVFFLISLLMIILFIRKKRKELLAPHLIIFVSTSFIIAYYFLSQTDYSSIEQNSIKGNDEFKEIKEYYDINHKLKSERFWRNMKKDSIWTAYDKKGNILEKKLYKNDRLLKVLK
jgi:glucan phosphoethanolaminetransferase (alkaline phosphatase superfamily)